MEKKRLLFIFLLILSIVIYGCDPTVSEQEVIEETPEIIEQQIEEIIENEALENETEIKSIEEKAKEGEPEEGETEPEPVVEEPESELFNPTLTYPEAYNGPLYATWEHASYNDETTYFNNLNRNGINFVIGAFSVPGKQDADTLVSNDGLGKIIYLAQKYPNRIVPVFSTGIGGAEEKSYLGDKLTGFYKDVVDSSNIIAYGIIRGFGEIETQEWPKPHDSPNIKQLFSLADSNNLFVMFHPLPGQKNAIENIAETYPDTIFLIHMFPEDFSKERSNVIDLLKSHENLYFSIDADHMMFDGQTGLLYKYEDRSLSMATSSFISDFDSKQNSLLNTAVSRYKPLVDAVPDKVMWGTEASPSYNFEPEVYDRTIKFSRMFIGKLNQEHQEMVAYKNALALFGKGAKTDKEIKIADTSNWPECTSAQTSQCEDECELAGPEESLENEICFTPCIIKLKCIDVFDEG